MRGRRKGQGGRKLGITVIVIVFIAVMAVQIYRLKQKDEEYAMREEELLRAYEDETQRSQELEELERYMGSSEYIEDVAKSRLGLIYDNEMIFKEREAK